MASLCKDGLTSSHFIISENIQAFFSCEFASFYITSLPLLCIFFVYVRWLIRRCNVHLLGPEKYWTYRWIHAVDGTSDRPFILEVFSSSQPEVFSHICPSRSTVSASI